MKRWFKKRRTECEKYEEQGMEYEKHRNEREHGLFREQQVFCFFWVRWVVRVKDRWDC